MNLFLKISILLILGRFFSYFSSSLNQPSVLGLLILGILLKYLPFGIGKFFVVDEVLESFADLGIIFLMALAGFDTDISALKREGKVGFLVALGGVVLPFLGAFLIGFVFKLEIVHSLFFGTALTATSVGITVMTLYSIKKLRTFEGRTILSAAVIDDVIGILVLSFFIGFTTLEEAGNFLIYTLLKIFLFFALLLFILPKFFNITLNYFSKIKGGDISLIGVALILFLSWFSKFCGLADITGAYFAGLLMSISGYKDKFVDSLVVFTQNLFTPLFFITIGLKTELKGFSGMWFFILIMLFWAVLGKVFGSILGALLGRVGWMKGLRIGVGMIPRGEVALTIASIALSYKIIENWHFSTIVMIVIFTSLITPIFLKKLFVVKKGG